MAVPKARDLHRSLREAIEVAAETIAAASLLAIQLILVAMDLRRLKDGLASVMIPMEKIV